MSMTPGSFQNLQFKEVRVHSCREASSKRASRALALQDLLLRLQVSSVWPAREDGHRHVHEEELRELSL